jgi:hypothetical protein
VKKTHRSLPAIIVVAVFRYRTSRRIHTRLLPCLQILCLRRLWRTDEDWLLLARVLREFGLGVFGHLFVNLEISEGTRAFGMDDPIRNPLPIDVSYPLDELEILQKSLTAIPGCLRVLVIIDGMTLVGGHIFGTFSLFYSNTPMLASGIKCIRVQLRNGSDRYSAVSMRRRLACPACLQRGAPPPFDCIMSCIHISICWLGKGRLRWKGCQHAFKK